MKNRLRLWPLLALFLAACAPVTTVVPTGTATLRSSATETPEPTRTRLPTRTPTITQTLMPWPTSTPLPAATPSDISVFGWEFSPNGEWVSWAVCCSIGYGDFKIVERVDKSQRWEIFFDFQSYQYRDGGFGPIHWSIDGNYMYYAVSPPFGGGLGGLYSSLYRFDLRSGVSAEVIPEIKNIVYAMGITLNDELLAYISIFEDQPPIFISDLETGIERSFTLDEYPSDFSVGEIFWSPTGDRFAFILLDHSEDNFNRDIILVDATSFANKVLIRFEGYVLPHLWGWEEINTIQVYIADSNYKCSDWLLDIDTGAVSAVHPDCAKKLEVSYPDTQPQP